MEPDQIIERLGSDNPPTVEELATAREQLTEAQDALKTSIREHSGTFAELRSLKDDFDNVSDALGKVTESLEAAQAEIDAIKAEVGVSDTETPVEDEPVEDEPEVEAEAKPVAASIRETLARVRTNPRQVETVNETDRLAEVSTTYTLMGKDAETIDPRMIGQAFADTKRKWGGSKTAVLSIKTDLAPERTLSGDASANERKMLDLFGTDPVVPVTAAGGCCSIPEPIYDQPLIGDLSRPIRGAFDVLNASRGAVQAYPPICIPDSGADVWTCAQDEAVDPEDPLTWKACVAIECEDSAPTLVEPIFKCLTIGTFQQKFAPEQWEAIVFQTDKLAVRLAEARLFDWLVASATSTHTGFQTDDTYVNFVRSLLRGAALIRQDQRLGDAQLVAVGPDWIYTAIAESTMTRRLVGADEIEVTRAKVDAVLREFGISYVGSQDVADLEDFQYDGALSEYPATAPVVLLPAGSAKVLDGGEKNLGIDVVDFDLARQNNVGAFSEFWEGLLVRNCNIKSIDIPIDVCGTVGACPT